MIKVSLLRHQRYISPPQLTSRVRNQRQKNVDFDTFDRHVMVNYIEPNLQEIIFGPIRVGLITQKQFWDHLKNCHSYDSHFQFKTHLTLDSGKLYLCQKLK